MGLDLRVERVLLRCSAWVRAMAIDFATFPGDGEMEFVPRGKVS